MAKREFKRVYVIPRGSHRNLDIPELHTIAEKSLFTAIELFLIKVDEMAPRVRDDLAKLRPLWTRHIEDALDSAIDSWVPQYTFLRNQVSDQESQALADAVFDWAKKYQLVDREQSKLRYVEIALQWLCLDSQLSAEERLSGYEVLLADAIEWDPSLGSDLLKKRTGQYGYWEDYRARNMPFVFSPPARRLGMATYSQGMMLVELSDQPAPLNVLEEMSQIVAYDRLRARLLGNLSSDETRARANRLSLPYRYGRVFNPEEERWDAFEAEVMHNFKVYLQAYKQAVLSTAFYDELPEKWDEPKHFEWLVSYICNSLSFDEIAGGDSSNKPNVSRSVRKVAQIIGIELNTTLGRRRKNTETLVPKQPRGRPPIRK